MKKIDELIQVLSNLKGLGRKNATRIAFDLLAKDKDEVEYILSTIKDCCENINPCKICNNLTDKEICEICESTSRKKDILCVVEDTRDIYAFDKNALYNGLYHVLGGKLSPLNGVGISELNIENLLIRLDGSIKEVILAISPDFDGEATMLYLNKILVEKGIKVTRLASGIPVGGNIEYLDSATLLNSLQGRIEIK